MSILLHKGSAYHAEFSSSDYPVLTSDWVGSVSLYSEYPGAAVFTKDLVRDGNVMKLDISLLEINSILSGLYYLVSTISNPVLGVEIEALEYATVAAATVFTTDMTKLFITVAKTDGTAAGHESRSISSSTLGVTSQVKWVGVDVTIANSVADKVLSNVVDTESVVMTTNAAGYAETYVIKGITYVVTCPVFGKTLTVNTTGLDSIDLSTYF